MRVLYWWIYDENNAFMYFLFEDKDPPPGILAKGDVVAINDRFFEIDEVVWTIDKDERTIDYGVDPTFHEKDLEKLDSTALTEFAQTFVDDGWNVDLKIYKQKVKS